MIAAITCMALNMYFEATGGNIDDRIGVSMVVLKRVDDPTILYPNTVCEVVYQPSRDPDRPDLCQFSWTCDEIPDEIREGDDETYLAMVELATMIYYGEIHYDPTFGSDHYIRCDKWASWKPKLKQTVVIGDHCYYK